MTVTGCLQPGADQSTFTLVAAASAAASPTGTSGTEGTAGTATARETAPNVQIKTITYLLIRPIPRFALFTAQRGAVVLVIGDDGDDGLACHVATADQDVGVIELRRVEELLPAHL